jgi:hypothetical protein
MTDATVERRTEKINFLGRDVEVFEPTDTQKAVLAQIARSSRVDMMTKVARFIDLMEAWFVSEEDREWFSAQMLDGVWSFETDVVPQVEVIAEAFAPEGNRADRRQAAKKAVAKRPGR